MTSLTQFRDILPKRIVRWYRQEFAWLGEQTGPARDLDVLLLQFDQEAMGMTSDKIKLLDPLKGLIEQKRSQSHKELKDVFQTTRYLRLMGDWCDYLATPVPVHTNLPDAERPIITVGTERIVWMYKQVRRRGKKLNGKSAVARLHEFRKDCKKLRYLMIFFEDLYSSKLMQPLIKAVTKLQDAFGTIRDLEVQQRILKEFHSALTNENGLSQDSLGEIEAWERKLKRHKRKLRTKCAKQLSSFDRPKNQARFRDLFSVLHEGNRPV